MTEIPNTTQDIEKILRRQLTLLAEKSEENKNKPDYVLKLSETMNSIAKTLLNR